MVSKLTVMVAISKEKDTRPPSGQKKQAVKSTLSGKRKATERDERLNDILLLSQPERCNEAHRRPRRHDRHDGQDHKHAAPQVTVQEFPTKII